MLIQKGVVQEPQGWVVFADADLQIGRHRFGGYKKGCEISRLGKSDFGVFGDGNPFFVTKMALADAAGADEAPVAVVMLVGGGISFFFFGFRFAATVIGSHFCFGFFHHTKIDKLFCVQAGWNQKSH